MTELVSMCCPPSLFRTHTQLEAILRETSMLEDEAAHAEATHEKMKDPLTVAEENLNIRRKRPPRELTRDAVERALNEQVEHKPR